MAGNNTITIKVNPNITNDPQVQLDDPAPKHKGRTFIRWIKDPEWVEANPDDDFKFVALAPDTAPLENPFRKIDVKKKRIKCAFKATSTDPTHEYPYMLVIEYNGVPYDTDPASNPDPGRAVIRN